MNHRIAFTLREVRATRFRCLAACAAALFLGACDGSFDGSDTTKINGSIQVPAGKAPTDVRTVNGAIRIDDHAAVTSASTVNGSIRIGAQATATSAKTVNGSITLGAGAHLAGSAISVNGDLSLASGAEVSGSLTNVNGKIDLTGAHVVGGIKTVDGSISIMGGSHVDGGILVQKQSGIVFNGEDPTIIIGPGATVQGELRFERKVRLFVSDRATIGTVSGATAVPFTGESP